LGKKGGTWIARFRDDDGGRQYNSVGAADDARDPDGLSSFNFVQAQERARAWFERKRGSRQVIWPHPMVLKPADALPDYRAE